MVGPVMVVYPDNVWYGGVTEGDCEGIIVEHCMNDRVVEMLRLTPDDFEVYRTELLTQCSTVLLLDMSWSMSWEGRSA